MTRDVVVPLIRARDDGAARPMLVLDPVDSVGVALRALRPGERIEHDGRVLVPEARVPSGHKIALRGIAAGERVIKYAQLIGVALEPIAAGAHVHTHNLGYVDDDARGGTLPAPAPAPVPIGTTDAFEGYRRADGRCGTRNFVAVVSSVNCSATVAHRIADGFRAVDADGMEAARGVPGFERVDGVAAFTHGTGCGMDGRNEGAANLRRVIAGYARHPNVAGVLLVGLGCEMSQIGDTVAREGLETGTLLRTMNIQSVGGHRETIARGRAMVAEMLVEANAARRAPCPASTLTLALQCGGSDALSGITANPALGHAADRLVRQGGTAVLAETPEIYGAEHLLVARAASPGIADALMARIAWWRDYVARNRGSLDNNPSPGNKLGGLTTILEKSLGAVAKGGTTPLNGVYEYAERVTARGFVFMDSPGYDPASVTGQIAGGCNLVAFTTGRGSTFGSKPAPCLKIATNTGMYARLSDDMDIDAGTIVNAGESVADVGDRIYARLLEVASGAPTLSEGHGLGDNEFVPWQIGATM